MSHLINNKIDIVIPTYNRVKTLEKAVNSVKNQEYSDWQLYILDNASTENTEGIIINLLSEKIHYIRNDTNIGMLRNWLRGITEIGDANYVVLLSDDDELCVDFLSKANEAINKFPDLGIYSSAVYIKNGDNTSTWMSEYIDKNKKKFEVCLPNQNLHYFLGGNPISPAAIMIKRESFNAITDQHLTNSSIWGFDRFWWAQIALNNTSVYYCSPTAIYNQHNQSETANLAKNNFNLKTQTLQITSNIINIALNLNLISIEVLFNEIKKLKVDAQLDVLISLTLFGNRNLNDAAKSYFHNRFKQLFPKESSFIKMAIYRLFGLKITAFIRMYKSRT